MNTAYGLLISLFLLCAAAPAQPRPVDPVLAPSPAPEVPIAASAPGPVVSGGRLAALDVSESARLARLRPSDPASYLELGEELLATPDSPERVDMTRQLLVRALEYGRTRPEHRRTAASAAIALASMSKREGDRLWLRSVAAILEPSSTEFAPARRAMEHESQAAANRASLFLTQLRAGAGVEARESLAASGVRQVLERHERELSALGTISVQHLESEARKWPCTDCNSTGIIAPSKGQRGAARLCPVCGGQPGMKLNAADLAAQLRLQRRLMGTVSEPWGSMIATEGAPPARDPDPANVATAFLVDVKLSVWRDDQWSLPDSPAPVP